MAGALLRAVIVAMVIVMPSALLADAVGENPLFIIVAALGAGLLTYSEYTARAPSLLDFRDAPPFNRLRFGAAAAMLLGAALIVRDGYDPNLASRLAQACGAVAARVLDFPASPVRLMVLALPADAPHAAVRTMRDASALAAAIAIFTILTFFLWMKIGNWPQRGRSFNVWVNLPLFDPTAGGDVVGRLRRDASLNLAAGILLPFLLPAVLRMLTGYQELVVLSRPMTLVWTVTAWGGLATSMIMRGMAFARIAAMIEARRRRVDLPAEELSPV